MNNARFVFCQYADDVRQEIGGKISFMGVYQGGLRVVGFLPAVLPKLVVVAHFVSPATQPFKALTFRVLWHGAAVQNISAPESLLDHMNTSQDPAAETFAVQVVIALQPFQIDANGKLEVFADVDGAEVAGNSLRIEIVPPEDRQDQLDAPALAQPRISAAPD